MYKNFSLNNDERKQILEMHQSHGYKKPSVNEYDDSNSYAMKEPYFGSHNNRTWVGASGKNYGEIDFSELGDFNDDGVVDYNDLVSRYPEILDGSRNLRHGDRWYGKSGESGFNSYNNQIGPLVIKKRRMPEMGDQLPSDDLSELDHAGFHDRDDLQVLRDAIDRNKMVSVAFVKKDGTVRHMLVRKSLKSYVGSDAEKTDNQMNVESNHDLKKVVDINSYKRELKRLRNDNPEMNPDEMKTMAAKTCWRSISLKNVLGFMVSGQFIDLRDENDIMGRFGEEVNNSLTRSMVNAMNQEVAQAEPEVENEPLAPENPEEPINESIKKIVITESQLKTIINRMMSEQSVTNTSSAPTPSTSKSNPSQINTTASSKPQSGSQSVSGSEMEKAILQGGNSGFKGVESAVNFCKSKNVPNISKIDDIEQMISSAIGGVENPLNVMGGSPGLQKVGQIIIRNISNTTELCSLLKHYYINGEDFLTAMKGEINTKLDSISAADFILNAINKINNQTKVN